MIWAPFFTSDLLFSCFLRKCHPRLHRKHNSEYSHKAFLIEHITFWTSKRPESSPCWCPHPFRRTPPFAPPPLTNFIKTNIFSTFSVSMPSKTALIHIIIIFDVVGTHISRYDCHFRAYDGHLESPIVPNWAQLAFIWGQLAPN